tara:strand:+ start:62 stop:355 length:294 start_codon:yes stop_codon:yes gene_type:complete
MYKVGDIVLVKSCAGDAIPAVHVKLVKKIQSKPYARWECQLTIIDEINILRKRWSMPFKHPDNIDTFVYEYNIIKKIGNNKPPKPRRRRTKSKRRTN